MQPQTFSISLFIRLLWSNYWVELVAQGHVRCTQPQQLRGWEMSLILFSASQVLGLARTMVDTDGAGHSEDRMEKIIQTAP